LSPPTSAELVVADYALTGLSLHAHPMQFLRERVTKLRAQPASILLTAPRGRHLAVAGLVITRQRPSTAAGVIFLTLEDETGHANVIVREDVQARNRLAVVAGRLVLVYGRVERAGQVVHLLAERVEDLTGLIAELRTVSHDFH